MNKLQQIKEKMQNRPEMQSAIELIEKELAQDHFESKMVSSMESLVAEIQNLLSNSSDGFDEVIKHLKINADFTKNLSNVAKQTQKVIVENPEDSLTQNKAKHAFAEALKTLESIVSSQNELPDSGNMSYGPDGKIDRISENYGSYTLVTTFSRNMKGQITSWKTTKI